MHELAQDLDQVDRLLDSVGRDRTRPLVVIGCAPCQGFSSHRNAKGESDTRNDLFVDFARIATHLDPDFIVIGSGSAGYFPNCASARAAGAAPIRAGEPGYSRKLDRDGDGVACE